MFHSYVGLPECIPVRGSCSNKCAMGFLVKWPQRSRLCRKKRSAASLPKATSKRGDFHIFRIFQASKELKKIQLSPWSFGKSMETPRLFHSFVGLGQGGTSAGPWWETSISAVVVETRLLESSSLGRLVGRHGHSLWRWVLVILFWVQARTMYSMCVYINIYTCICNCACM